ncbi:MAG: biotin--[acetyl-CoA-carboxylase] ligase [Candidatus Scalindua sp. AMX11]|nr:MAG: biotin--[acetyl-CoA-carboxylase] ligase [Candidatus Scalindua sp.]NOG83382.1 biotin--[acetyl-CoA-carboxylase] ligase [Planctomycetota bacterium]RZV65544.1 MAG: biotin--[acetyl-CoA-carboxylase] ligase [Candidatus Scalindua sp. SCAELEC01]TDE63531.1 MAG: biotin--[acetyl-CoA-carboxylase] ligase [Candidatus Scalindua sp. AMX11]GJQ60586.1 MAG: biotin--[acetyl-CoA-carboxylase] ligase [Candidatus Scalindua sp.]
MKFLQPEWHDKVSSTNTVLMDWLKDGVTIPMGFVLAAVEQTAGHGRYNRHWVSQSGLDLTFSFLLYTKHTIEGIASLPMAVALGTAVALDTFGIITKTKWPNDLLVRKGKIGGILCEKSNFLYKEEYAVVVGLGINVNMQEENASTIGKPATSLRIETGRMYPIKDVLDIILEILPHWIDRWEQGGFPSIRDDWIARCCHMGEHITVGEGKNLKSGILEGFGDKGQLLLRGDDGYVRDVWTGDVE